MLNASGFTVGAVLVLAGGFLYSIFSYLVCPLFLHLVEWEMLDLILMENQQFLSGKVLLEVLYGRLTPLGNTSYIAWYLGTEIHRFLYFQAIHSHSCAMLLGSKGL